MQAVQNLFQSICLKAFIYLFLVAQLLNAITVYGLVHSYSGLPVAQVFHLEVPALCWLLLLSAHASLLPSIYFHPKPRHSRESSGIANPTGVFFTAAGVIGLYLCRSGTRPLHTDTLSFLDLLAWDLTVVILALLVFYYLGSKARQRELSDSALASLKVLAIGTSLVAVGLSIDSLNLMLVGSAFVILALPRTLKTIEVFAKTDLQNASKVSPQ